MRLEPIDRAPTWLGRIASWVMRRQLGTVIMPARVIYNRVPRMYNVAYALVRLLQGGLRLDAETRLLVQCRVAMINQCTFCVDIGRAQAVQEQIGLEKFNALPDWRTSPLFHDRQRAALAYVEEVNRTRRASNETFAELRKHFDERGVVELTILNAVENYFNYLNLPLGIEEDGLCAIAQARSA